MEHTQIIRIEIHTYRTVEHPSVEVERYAPGNRVETWPTHNYEYVTAASLRRIQRAQLRLYEIAWDVLP